MLKLYSYPRSYLNLTLNIVLALSLCSFGLSTKATTQTEQSENTSANNYAAEWLILLNDRVKGERLTPPVAARIYAYASLSMQAAMALGSEDIDPLVQSLRGSINIPKPITEIRYDPATILSSSVAQLSVHLMENTTKEWQPFLSSSIATKEAISSLQRRQLNERAQLIAPEELEQSIQLGHALADAMLAWSGHDNLTMVRDMMFSSSHELFETRENKPSAWIPRAVGRMPIEPFWGLIRPLSLNETDQCHVPLNINFDTESSSEFYQQALEVYELSQNLSEEAIEIAYFWDDEPIETGTLAGHFLMIATQMAEQFELGLAEASHAYAVLAVAMHDAFVSAWWSKYHVMLLRPNTFINDYIDPEWTSLLQNPNFPEYPSGHAVVGAAAAEVLTAFFGTIAYDDPHGIVNPAPGFALGNTAITRSFTSFKEAAKENAFSRLYGGVHYPIAAENGLVQGQCVGNHIVEHLIENADLAKTRE